MTEIETRIHRTGTPAEGHVMSLESLRDLLNEVIAAHEPFSEVPDAVIRFPAGFWITYASPNSETIAP